MCTFLKKNIPAEIILNGTKRLRDSPLFIYFNLKTRRGGNVLVFLKTAECAGEANRVFQKLDEGSAVLFFSGSAQR